MTKITRCLLLVVLTSLPLPAWASELFGKISYKGTPLKNAEITVKDKTISTNEIGYYSVDLDPGPHTLVIKLPDGGTKEAKVDVFPQNTEKNLKLE
jgi:uncharacterized GH25 family protein